MTSSLANVFLILATLLFLLLFLPIFYHKVAQSNDQGATGYVIIIVGFIHLLIFGFTAAAYVAIGRDGYFNWVPGHAFLRTLLMAIGLLACVIISSISIMSRIAPGSNPAWLQAVGRYTPVLMLVIIVGTGFIVNNHFLRESIPLPVYKWPFLILNAACLTGVFVLVLSSAFSGPTGVQEATRKYESEESIKTSRLAEIESADVSGDLERLLEFTGGLYPPEVRQKAAVKIMTDTAWQHNLLRLMEHDQALAVFNFLQSNEVNDKNLFVQPVLKGVGSIAAWIRHSIQGTSPSGFYSDMFSDEVQRVLRTVEKFEGMGVNYLPAVKEMRSSLDEPGANNKVNYACIPVLEEWITQRE